jgi:alpha-1,2-mannosyltransferase
MLVGIAAIVLVSGFLTSSSIDLYGWDFRTQYYGGAKAVVDGEPLFASPDEVTLHETPVYVYPPLTAVVFTPLTILPEDVAVILAVIASLGAVLGALALVGLRDLRCYAAVVGSAPIWNTVETANLTAVLTLGLAVAWRVRATVWPLATVLGLAVSAKLFLWPLVGWAVATRRLRAAVLSVVIGLSVTLATWALIGFQGLTGYPALLDRLVEVWGTISYSIVGMTAAVGLEPSLGRAFALLLGGVLLAACFASGRREDDRRAFTWAIAAAFVITPIVWVHYVVVLLVPLALARPRFSAVWLLPMVLWVSPRTGHGDGLDPFVPALVIVLLLSVMLSQPRARGSRAEALA